MQCRTMTKVIGYREKTREPKEDLHTSIAKRQKKQEPALRQ
jgi:hypothetical protein